MRTNSSPPTRPTVSTSRTDSASTAATRRRTSSPAAWPPSRLVAWKSSMSNMASETSLPCRPARASSSSSTRATVRSFARPVRGSEWAIRSNHSERSAAVELSRARSTASAARPAMPVRVPRSTSVSVRVPGQPKPIAPRETSTPPLTREQRQVGAGEGLAGGGRRLAVEGRGPLAGRGGERVGRVGRLAGKTGVRRVVHADRRREDHAGPILIGDEDRAHHRAGRGSSGLQQCGQRGVEVARLGDRDDRRGEGRSGVAREGIVGHGGLLHASLRSEPASYTLRIR